MKPHKLVTPHTAVVLIAFFALAGLVQTVLGQGCSSWMTPSYSTYYSSSSDGTYVYTSVAISGTAYGNCPVGCDCQGVTHEPGAYNVLGGSTGGMEYGARVPWNNYLGETNDQQLAAAPGTLVSFSYEGLVICTVVGYIYQTGEQSTQAASYTHIQHNYPNDPFGSKPCWISQFFDHISPVTGRPHHAEDVVKSNGTGGGVVPSLGDPVYAAEGGTVVYETGSYGPASPPYPNCGSHDANYVKIKGADGYYTVYIHVKPSVANNQVVNAGDPIGTVDNSGCQSKPHVHIQREDSARNKFNFTLPCTNPTPTSSFWDGLVDDIDNDY